VPTAEQAEPTCDFKSRKVILQQAVSREQMQKLLETGKTDLLDGFVSMRTRRAFKAHLKWDAEAGKVNFEFAASKFPNRRKPTFTGRAAAAAAPGGARKTGGKKAAAKAPRVAKVAKDPNAPKKPRKAGPGLKPSPELAAVIGDEAVPRTEVIKKLWVYIKEHGLQDATNKRAINADDKLLKVFGKPQVTMFELAGVVGKHLTS
jgi:DNA topoisomerase-3